MLRNLYYYSTFKERELRWSSSGYQLISYGFEGSGLSEPDTSQCATRIVARDLFLVNLLLCMFLCFDVYDSNVNIAYSKFI